MILSRFVALSASLTLKVSLFQAGTPLVAFERMEGAKPTSTSKCHHKTLTISGEVSKNHPCREMSDLSTTRNFDY